MLANDKKTEERHTSRKLKRAGDTGRWRRTDPAKLYLHSDLQKVNPEQAREEPH